MWMNGYYELGYHLRLFRSYDANRPASKERSSVGDFRDVIRS